jgi:hypothetical protein
MWIDFVFVSFLLFSALRRVNEPRARMGILGVYAVLGINPGFAYFRGVWGFLRGWFV